MQSGSGASSLLKPDNLDPDLLDERARALLDYADPHDLTLMLPRERTKDDAGMERPSPF